MQKSAEFFERIYKTAPQYSSFTPYRVCLLGAHIDHQLGKITGFALDKGIHMAYSATSDGSAELTSLQFHGSCRFDVNNVPETKQNDWADYLRGAVIALAKRYPIYCGLRGVIDGELPIGGLSSSAAVTITFLTALCRLNGIKLTPDEAVTIAREAENNYVGVACGKLDQSCEVYCRRDHLLYMDMQDDSFENIPAHPDMKPYRIAVFYSGVGRTLAGSKYNMRVDEARSAAYALMAYSGMDYGKFAEASLRAVPREAFEKYGSLLPEPWRKRAEHCYSEFERVEQGVRAWRTGNTAEFGRLVTESGRSSIEVWETGSPELKALYEIMIRTDGVYGGRFSGAGFKGCCAALVDPSFEESIRENVTREYLKVFPELGNSFRADFCNTADGVKLI